MYLLLFNRRKLFRPVIIYRINNVAKYQINSNVQ